MSRGRRLGSAQRKASTAHPAPWVLLLHDHGALLQQMGAAGLLQVQHQLSARSKRLPELTCKLRHHPKPGPRFPHSIRFFASS